MNATDYDKYYNAIVGTNFSALETLVGNLDQIESTVINKLGQDIDWEGDANEALRAKVESIRPSFRSFKSNETANIKSIISLSKELKEKIDEFKNTMNDIAALESKLKSLRIAASSIPDTDIAQKNSNTAEINSVNSQISNKNKIALDQKHSIELLVTKLKSIEFGTLFVSEAVTVGESIQVDTPEIADVSLDGYKIDGTLLASISSGDYDNYFRNTLEKPIRNNLQMIGLAMRNLEEQRHLVAIVLTNMPGTTDPAQLAALDMARLSHERLTQQIEIAQKSYNQHQALLDKYKAINKSGNLFSPGNGEIKDLVLKRDKETDPAKIEEYNNKIIEAVNRFNEENINSANIIELTQVVPPFMADMMVGQEILGPEVGYTEENKITEVLSLFTESLYNSPRFETEMTPIYGANNEITGYTLTDNRNEDREQVYTVNKTDGGYDLVIGGKESIYFPLSSDENKNNY